MRPFLIVLALTCAACGSSPTAPAAITPPPPPPVAACTTNNTGTVYFQNRSATALTYDVIWDGAKLTTLAPNTDSQVYTFAAGIAHTLRFQVTNTTVNACNPGTPILTVCGATFYGCSG